MIASQGNPGNSAMGWRFHSRGRRFCRLGGCSRMGILVVIVATCILLKLWLSQGSVDLPFVDYSAARKCLIPKMSSPLSLIRNTCVYVYSVFGHESRPQRGRFNVIINGWDGGATASHFLCCFLLENSSMDSVQAMTVNTFYGKPAPFRAVQFNCPYSQWNAISPAKVGLTARSCSDGFIHWRKIVRAESLPGKVGICAKVAYGQLDHERVVDWFKMQRLLGVSRVLLYTYQLQDSRTIQLLTQSTAHSMLKLVRFDIPKEVLVKPNRSFEQGRRYLPQFVQDEQVAVLDCQERLAGMSYVLQLDLDEVLLPTGQHRSLPELFEKELFGRYLRYPLAATFTFSVKFHITDWYKGDSEDDKEVPFFLKHHLATAPRYECIKTVHMPDRIRVFYTHEAFPRAWYYFMYNVDPSVATVHHFRSCPEKWQNCATMARFTDHAFSTYRYLLMQRRALNERSKRAKEKEDAG